MTDPIAQPSQQHQAHKAFVRLGAALPWLPPPDLDVHHLLAAAERRARTRTLSAGDVEHVLLLYQDVLTILREEPALRVHTVTVEIHGGRVPNSYGYGGKSTWATVDSRAGLDVTRGPALSNPYARGWSVRVQVYLDCEPPADVRPVLSGQKARRVDGRKRILT